MHRSTTARAPILLVAAALVLAGCGATPAATTDDTPEPTMAATASPMASESATASAEATESAEPTEEATGETEVVLGMSSFSPTELTIDVGTTVRFNNTSSLPHTVTHGTAGRPADDAAFDRSVSEGAAVTITFDEAGTFDVTCKIHPTMQMTITVEG